jgi:hypothetical protein
MAMKQFIENFNNASEFNYSVHISDDFQFIYFNNPKCACTTVKASLNLACATALGQKLSFRDIGDIHNRRMNILLTPAQVGCARFRAMLEDASYFKFCFVREPVRRVASAFASKLAWQSESLVALNRRLGHPDDAPLGFADFIKILSTNPQLRDMDEHWRLQRKQVCFDLVRFDMIGLFEHLAADLQAVLSRVFGPGAERPVFDVRQYFAGNISNASTLVQSLTADTIATIRQIYRADEDLYATARDAGERARDSAVQPV